MEDFYWFRLKKCFFVEPEPAVLKPCFQDTTVARSKVQSPSSLGSLHLESSQVRWLWVKKLENPSGDHRFWLIFPITKPVFFWGYPLFLTHWLKKICKKLDFELRAFGSFGATIICGFLASESYLPKHFNCRNYRTQSL